MWSWREQFKIDIARTAGIAPDDIDHVDVITVNSAAGVDSIYVDVVYWNPEGERATRPIDAGTILTMLLHSVLDLDDRR